MSDVASPEFPPSPLADSISTRVEKEYTRKDVSHKTPSYPPGRGKGGKGKVACILTL